MLFVPRDFPYGKVSYFGQQILYTSSRGLLIRRTRKHDCVNLLDSLLCMKMWELVGIFQDFWTSKNPATAVIVNQVLVTKQMLIARRFTYSVYCVYVFCFALLDVFVYCALFLVIFWKQLFYEKEICSKVFLNLNYVSFHLALFTFPSMYLIFGYWMQPP